MFGTHDVISSSVCLTGDNRNFRNGSLTISIQQLRPVTNNTTVFLIYSRKESRHIHQCQQRYIESVAETDETGSLDRCINIQRPCQYQRLVSNDSHRLSVQTDITGNNIRRKFRLKFEETVIVSHGLNHFLDIIRLVRIRRNQVRKFRSQASGRIARCYKRRFLHIISRQIRNQFADIVDTFNIIFCGKMSHAGFGHVHAYSTQIFLAHLLLCHTFHDIRAGNKHIAGIFYHENKVSQCR